MIEKGICMADGKTGAIILAAGRSAHMEELKPMLRMGQTTMIQREIDTIRQAGISPIVVVTGYQADVLERHISHRGAVCIRNKRYETSQMYGSICMGLRHLLDCVRRDHRHVGREQQHPIGFFLDMAQSHAD